MRTNSLFRNRDKTNAKVMTVPSMNRIMGSEVAQEDSESLMSRTREAMMKVGSVASVASRGNNCSVPSEPNVNVCQTSVGFKKQDEEDVDDLELANCQELLNENSSSLWRNTSERIAESTQLEPEQKRRQISEVVGERKRNEPSSERQEFVNTGDLKFIKQVARKSDTDT